MGSKLMTYIKNFFSDKKEVKRTLFCILMVSISTFIYCIGVMWFLEPAAVFSGGVTGIAQLITNVSEKWLGYKVNLGLLIFLINVPIVLFGWKKVSKIFAVCSVISIILQTVLMSGIIPNFDFGINTGINPITNVTIGSNSNKEMDLLLLSITGGFITGLGASLALRYGTSTGGIDIIAQAISFKKNVSIGFISLIVNIVIAILGAMVFGAPAILFYTIARIVTQSIVTDRIHTAYNYLKVEIVTVKGDEMTSVLISNVGRGITLLNAIGGYTHVEKTLLETIVSSYELEKVITDAKKIDPNAFISVIPIKTVVGNFKKKTIA